jgi:hypothetical protein
LSDSPIPASADPDDQIALARALRWTSIVIGTAALVLLVFNATALKNWSASLNPNTATVAAAGVAAAWEDMTGRVGLTAPRAVVHDAWATGRGVIFPQKAGPAGADEAPR